MNTVSRQFSRLGLSGQRHPRQPGDNARVSVLLNDFADADKVLAAIIDNCRLWRDSWAQLLSAQHGTIVEYEKLYDPVVGASDGCGQHLQPTPKLQVNRTFRLREAYDELKKELSQEITQIDTRVIQPATDVRELTTGVKKTIKKRENKRADFEKSSDKVLKLQRKMGRTTKEDAALAKAQAEMERLQEVRLPCRARFLMLGIVADPGYGLCRQQDFLAADSHLLETLPPLINAKFSLLPVLLESLILVQNTILGLYYTYLNQYCKDYGFPSPPPPMEDVIAIWSTSFEPVRREIEAIAMIARGKGIKSPLTVGDEPGRPQVKPQNLPSFSLRGGLRRTSTQASVNEAEEEEPPLKPPRPGSIRSAASTRSVSPNPATTSQSMLPDYSGPQGYIAPTAFTTACNLGQTPTHLTRVHQDPDTCHVPPAPRLLGPHWALGVELPAPRQQQQ